VWPNFIGPFILLFVTLLLYYLLAREYKIKKNKDQDNYWRKTYKTLANLALCYSHAYL